MVIKTRSAAIALSAVLATSENMRITDVAVELILTGVEVHALLFTAFLKFNSRILRIAFCCLICKVEYLPSKDEVSYCKAYNKQ